MSDRPGRKAALEVVEGAGRAQPVAAPHPPGDDAPTLRSYLDTILEARWLILLVTLTGLASGLFYYLAATPIYLSDALVQVEEKSKGIAGLEDLTAVFSSQSQAETEMEILRSRTLVGAVVDELGLDVVARPQRLPLVGNLVARFREASKPAPPLLGMSSFAWGGETITVTRLDVPPRWRDRKLTLVARGEGAYELFAPGDVPVARGVAGHPSEQVGASGVELFVAGLEARPGTHFRLVELERARAIEQLQKKLVLQEKGKKTGVIRMALESEDAAKAAATLDAISRRYLRQNVERKSAEAEKTLDFLSGQLPVLRQNLEAAEAALNDYKARKGSIDLSLETKGALDQIVEVEKQLTQVEMLAAEARQRFTESHPALATLKQKTARLRAERDEINARIKKLPEAELNSARLQRDLKVANELYVLLLNKTQELRVVKSGTIGNVRILDQALMPIEPVSPKPANTLALAGLFGLTLGVAAAFVRRSLTQGVDDPEVMERETGLPVYASVPHSGLQAACMRTVGRKSGNVLPVLAVKDPNDLAVEALRSLRTSLQFALAESRNNVVAIGGPSPGIGKSFVCVNLAHVLADAGKRVLLVDADMRKGRLHRYFDGKKAPGLSDLIAGACQLQDAVKKTSSPNLEFLGMGVLPPNPSELLSSQRYQDLVEQAAKGYDVVLLDTAPVLAVTDGALAARCAGISLLVLRAGQHPVREVQLTVKRMAQNGVAPHALIMNDLMPKAPGASYSRYGYHYHYEYR